MNEIPLSDLPSDILNSAAIAVEAMPQRAPFKADVMEAIARAILAERERCAAIAKAAADTFERCGPLSLGSMAADVWFRIRQGQAKEGESA